MIKQPAKYPNKLREFRRAKGLKQIDVSRALGFRGEDRILHWEKGQSVPHLVNLLKLCRMYHTTLEELYPQILKMDNVASTTTAPDAFQPASKIEMQPELP